MPTHHVIIGAGPAATNALETIRQFDTHDAEITLICDELPHARMALPYWLAGAIPRDHTLTADADYFQRHRVRTIFGHRVAKVDTAGNSLTLDSDTTLSYDRLLIATGSSPLRLPIPGVDLPGVQPLWTLDHTQAVLDATVDRPNPRVVLVGAGFIGFIVLNAMFKRNWQLTVVEREQQVLPRMLDAEAADTVERWLARRNVTVHTGTTVQAIEPSRDGCKRLQLNDGSLLEADLVILATGIRPNLELVAGSEIATDAGIVVDDHLRTSVPNVFAAGDVAQGPVLFRDEKQIHAIQPTAVDHGRVAGANMAGHSVPYPGSLLMNVVDVCGLQCASFGQWQEPGAELTTISNPTGSIYRKLVWREDQLVGAIFTGRAQDLGMLTDVGMVKGILQTQTPLGSWKNYLHNNPFDVRRAYIAAGVAQKLANTTLLGEATLDRSYRFANRRAEPAVGAAHSVLFESFGT